jgi:hypothetical protein
MIDIILKNDCKNQHPHCAAEGRIFAFMPTLCHSAAGEESHILSIFKREVFWLSASG